MSVSISRWKRIPLDFGVTICNAVRTFAKMTHIQNERSQLEGVFDYARVAPAAALRCASPVDMHPRCAPHLARTVPVYSAHICIS